MLPIRRIRNLLKHLPGIEPLNRLRLRRIYRSMPPVINLELTTKCNARCRMCPHPESDFGKRTLSLESLDKLLDGLAGCVRPGTVLYPVGLGEPLLIPSLYEMNRRIAERFPQAIIQYNTIGILLGNARSDTFLDFAHKLVISLKSPGKAEYQALMGVDRYDEVVAGIQDFLKRRCRHARFIDTGLPRIDIQMMGLDAYTGDFPDFEKTWRLLLDPRDQVHFNPMDNWGGRIPDKDLYRATASPRYPCGSPWRMASIDVDGNVFPCCVPFGTRSGESIRLGNVFAEPLDAILRNGILDRIKKIHLQGKEGTLEACRDCDVYRVDPNIRFRNPISGEWA